MKNVTLSADARLIDSAREKARAQHSTLNEEFRRWLAQFVEPEDRGSAHDEIVARLRSEIRIDRKFTREEMNER